MRENILVALDDPDHSRSGGTSSRRGSCCGATARCGAEADTLLAALPAELGLRLRRAPTCPYGTQRRVEIARAMARQPRLLLLDEPAAGLNARRCASSARSSAAIRDSGVTVVLIEHNMGLVMSLCERVTVLASGGSSPTGTPETIAHASAGHRGVSRPDSADARAESLA